MGELREKVAREIRDHLEVSLHNAGDDTEYELDNIEGVADRILALLWDEFVRGSLVLPAPKGMSGALTVSDLPPPPNPSGDS